MFKQQRSAHTHEDVFLARYDQLMAWAGHLTDHDRQQAEDLVHDVFVKFALTRPDLQRIENLDGYLYTALRNTHRSQIRRAGRGSLRQMSLLDYDSAELGLRFVEPRHALDVQEELRMICRYACLRKETSKAASVLILRYFLGYFPSEIALVLRAERQAVAESLRVARAEARLFVDDPQRLRFAVQSTAPEPRPINVRLTIEDLLPALRKQIFSARSGECLSREELRQRYRGTEELQVERQTLAHLVSCPRCLDEVNSLLGLPPIADRNPTDFTGSDPGSRGGMGETDLKKGGGKRKSGASGAEALKRFRRRVQLVYEHDPKELRIAVNGRLLGAQEIGAELNRQTLSLNEAEPITFIEVYSEQEVRLAYMVVEEPPNGEFEQHEIIGLSDERRLDLSLSFKGLRPELQVIYHNPSLRTEAAALAPRSNPALLAEISVPADSPEEDETFPRTALSRLFLWFRRMMTPPRIAVATCMIALAAWLLFGHSDQPTVASVLRQAAAAETAQERLIASRPDQAFHRVIEIEELRPANRDDKANETAARRRVEVWRSAGKRLLVRRLYDENGRLVAGERREEKSSPGSSGSDWAALRAAQTLALDDLWRLDLSAGDFLGFVEAFGLAAAESLEIGSQAYVISYQNSSRSLDRGLVSATLALARDDLRAIEQRFHLRYGSEDRVIRFVEKSSAARPLSEIGGQVFEIEPELRGAAEGDAMGSDSAAIRQVSSPAAPAPLAATAELEIRTLTLLHQAGADLGEEVSLTRSANGKLKIEAVVTTARRKAEILQALATISTHPAVSIRIETTEEARWRKSTEVRAPAPRVIEEYAATAAAIPAHSELRAYFGGKLAGQPSSASEIEAEIRQFATQMVRRSQRALQRAYALRRLSTHFSPDEIRALDDASRAEWLSLIREHASGFSSETAAMRRQLSMIIRTPAEGEIKHEGEIKDDAGLLGAIERLFELAAANDRAVRSAFAVRAQAASGPPVKMDLLWRTLLGAEMLSTEIQRKSSANN